MKELNTIKIYYSKIINLIFEARSIAALRTLLDIKSPWRVLDHEYVMHPLRSHLFLRPTLG